MGRQAAAIVHYHHGMVERADRIALRPARLTGP
jgi:hypothetical protein